MVKVPMPVLEAEILSEVEILLDLADFCRQLHCDPWEAEELVAYGIAQPVGGSRAEWRFHPLDIRRSRLSRRLCRDLEIDLQGAALVVEILERREG